MKKVQLTLLMTSLIPAIAVDLKEIPHDSILSIRHLNKVLIFEIAQFLNLKKNNHV